MNEDRLEQLASTAAKWWADQLRSQELSHFDTGDESLSGGIIMLLGALNTSHPKQDINRSQKIDCFEHLLKDKFKAMLKKKDNYILLMVDYYPNQILVDAAKKAGLMRRFFPKHGDSLKLGFPMKTWMSISYKKGIYVSKGQRIPVETILE